MIILFKAVNLYLHRVSVLALGLVALRTSTIPL